MPSVPPPSTSCANVPVSGYVLNLTSTKFSTVVSKESSSSKHHSALYCSLGQTPCYPVTAWVVPNLQDIAVNLQLPRVQFRLIPHRVVQGSSMHGSMNNDDHEA